MCVQWIKKCIKLTKVQKQHKPDTYSIYHTIMLEIVRDVRFGAFVLMQKKTEV